MDELRDYTTGRRAGSHHSEQIHVVGSRRLSGETLGSNVGSARIMEKCGFKREGMQSRYYVARGQVHDNVLFGLLREELTFDLDEMTSRFHPLR